MWIHSLTMPRFLTIKEGKLCQEVPENIKNEYAHLDIDSKRIKPEEDTVNNPQINRSQKFRLRSSKTIYVLRLTGQQDI